ncbi:MAG: OmpA family protein [Bdellovibrionales bacterium]|nr:OmpA family protein [Bdellovibrionales bacterium]
MKGRSARINFIVREPLLGSRKLVACSAIVFVGFALALFSGSRPKEEPLPVSMNPVESVAPVESSAFLNEVESRILGVPGVEKLDSGAGKEELTVEFKSDQFFRIGTANLEQRSIPEIRKVAVLLKEAFSSAMIEIEGHTDASPVVKQRRVFPSNWELSAARAASLLHIFEEEGFPKSQLKVSGYGDSRPMGDREDANRRIIVRVIRSEGGEGG